MQLIVEFVPCGTNSRKGVGYGCFSEEQVSRRFGIKEDYGLNWLSKDDDRLKDFNDEKEMYGFCSAETWNMDRIFCEWLYSHCKMYLEKVEGIIDMEFN